ncbi:MAG: Rieske 2Fe-2S domain-containing protein, partial [Chloroflexi bacterium]|nr:Rieske 2Fe-2S domain-containing protein [Chloroflexota bacterium]
MLVLDNTRQGTFKVHRSAFVDDQVYSHELAAIFRRCWLYVAHESEVPSPGDFVTRNVAGQGIIVSRDQAGHLQVLFNTCAHQGSEVCRVARGHANSFQCFFHGWTYRLDGRVLAIPGRESYGGSFDSDGLGLARPGGVESYRGFIFLAFEP